MRFPDSKSGPRNMMSIFLQSDQLMMNNNMELPFGKRFSPEQIRKASIRWGKRAMVRKFPSLGTNYGV